MPITTGTELIEVLRQNAILDPAQANGLFGDPRVATLEARAMARELIECGLLTAYQANLVLTDRVRDLLLGPYILLERLGRGATGDVYKARHGDLGHIVALKVLRKECVEQH